MYMYSTNEFIEFAPKSLTSVGVGIPQVYKEDHKGYGSTATPNNGKLKIYNQMQKWRMILVFLANIR